MNCDGRVDFADINVFTLALQCPACYAAQYPNCQIILGDLNGDGQVNFDDINGFVALISNSLAPESRRYHYDEENRLTAVKQWDDVTKVLEIQYDALGRRVQSVDYRESRTPCGTTRPSLTTRHIYGALETVAEYIDCAAPTWTLAREFVYGASFTEPISLIDYTALGDKPLDQPEVLHYVRDALGSVTGLTDAGDPNHNPPVPAKEVGALRVRPVRAHVY